jgi:hypothetical protein
MKPPYDQPITPSLSAIDVRQSRQELGAQQLVLDLDRAHVAVQRALELGRAVAAAAVVERKMT